MMNKVFFYLFFTLNNLFLIFCYIVPDVSNIYYDGNDLRIQTDSGIVQGELKTNSMRPSFQIRQFIGIPYAQKPTDIYRFSKPQAFVPEIYTQNSVINTRQEVKCIQAKNYRNQAYSNLFDNIYESEDCLYLNIYAPRVTTNGPKYPVVVYIHGGEFKVGSKYVTNPEQLVDTKTILVTVNYRLGVFGFLSFDNEYLPGNLGIHDVILALKWINREISRFNGDSNMVTLLGHDSGAIIANLLMVSNLADGVSFNQRLFHRVILSGGNIFSPFAMDYFPRYQTQTLAIEVGCGQHHFNGRNLLQCLREKSSAELLKVVETIKSSFIKDRQLYFPDGPIPDLDFRPVIDSNRTYALFKRNPLEMFENDEYSKEIPVIVLLTEFEGSHYLFQMENELRLNNNFGNNMASNGLANSYSNYLNYTDVVAKLIMPYLRPDSNLGALSNAILHQYFADYLQKHNGINSKQYFDQEAFKITSSMMGDFLQYGPAHRLLKHHSINSLAQLYIFNFGNNRIDILNRKCTFWPNAQYIRCPTHTEDIFYLLFNSQSGLYNLASNLLTLVKRFSHAESLEQFNYYSPNRQTFFYRKLNVDSTPNYNFRSIDKMNFWTNFFLNLQKETLHESIYFPFLQYQDFQYATYSLATICGILLLVLLLIGVYLYRKKTEEKRTLKLLRARDRELQQRYEEVDQLDEF